MIGNADTTRKLTVAVVNDSPTQRRLLESLLTNEGIDVLSFMSAGEALQQIAAERTTPDLIVTDLHMPGIDGWRFCRLLRSPEYATLNTVPILIVSATYAGEDVQKVCTASGANAFLPLPVSGTTFLTQVRALLAGKIEPIPLRLLVVEDSTTLANALKGGLTGHGYQVEVAHDGQTATRLFAKMKPDLVLLDYHLPDTTGENLLQTFAAQKPRPVVVMMTADPDPALAVKWHTQGAAAYVRKPFKVDYLATLCAGLLRERNLLNIEDLLEARTRELAVSEERYRRITQGITDYIYTVQVKNGKELETTHGLGCVAVTGYREEDFAADPGLWHRIVPQEDRPRVEQHARKLLRGQNAIPIEHRIVRRDGAVRWVSTSPVLHPGEDGRVLSYDCLVKDITERTCVQEALRQSELSYRTIFEAATDAIFVHDIETGRILDVNEAACRLWGYSIEEMKALDLAQISSGVPPYTKKEAMEWVRKASNEGPQFFTWLVKRRDGTLMWFEDTLKRVTIGGQDRVLVVGRDITERRRVEEALRKSEEKYRTLLDHASDAILLADTEGNLLEANKTALRLFGYSREELLGMNISAIHQKEELEDIVHTFREMVQNGSASIDNTYVVRKDKSIVPVAITGSGIEYGGIRVVQGFFRDITEPKRAQAEALLQHQELQLVLDSVVATIWYLDTEGRVVKWNHLAEKASGMTSSQVRGETIHTLAPTWDDPDRRHRETLSVALLGQPLLGSIESFRKDGEVQWVRVDKVPWRDTHGKLIGVILFIYDITDHKRVEQEREKLILELRDALDKIKTLRGLLPICASCKKVRNDKGYWEQIEVYVRDRSDAQFTHGLCPDCTTKLYPEFEQG